MAGWKTSKTKSRPRKGQEAKKKEVLKLIENAAKGLSGDGSVSTAARRVKFPSSTSSVCSDETSTSASLMTARAAFSQTVNPIVPSPQKAKPVINLTHIIHSRPATCKTPENLRPEIFKQRSRQHQQPKPVVPGPLQDSRCRDPDFLIRDQRHENRGLVLLPKEPDVKRTPDFVPKGHFRFLDLPAEIRNQIYGYLIGSECYAVQWDGVSAGGRKQLTHRLPQRSKAWQPRLSQSTRQRRADLKQHPPRAEREKLMSDIYHICSPISLFWVCRKMYIEASSMFYSKSTFIFTGIGPLRQFMNNATPRNKASITKLKLIYKAYGHPAKTEDQIWKIKADRKWEDLCWRITYEFTSLTHLVLDLDYGYSRLQFIPFFDLDSGSSSSSSSNSSRLFGTNWRIPLWAFDDLDLRSCVCRLRSATTSETVLEVESYKVRQALLGDAWDDEVEGARDAFGCCRKRHHGGGSKAKRAAPGVIRITNEGEVFGLV